MGEADNDNAYLTEYNRLAQQSDGDKSIEQRSQTNPILIKDNNGQPLLAYDEQHTSTECITITSPVAADNLTSGQIDVAKRKLAARILYQRNTGKGFEYLVIEMPVFEKPTTASLFLILSDIELTLGQLASVNGLGFSIQISTDSVLTNDENKLRKILLFSQY